MEPISLLNGSIKPKNDGGQEGIRTPEGRAIWFTARPV